MFLKRSSVTTSGSLIDPSGTCTISSHSRRHRPPDGAFRSLLSNTRRRIKIGPSTSVSESSSSSSSEDSSQALNACLAYIVEDGDNQDLAFLLQVVTHGLRALTNCSTSTPHERMTGIPLHGQMSPRNLYEIRVIARKVVSSRFLPVDFIGLETPGRFALHAGDQLGSRMRSRLYRGDLVGTDIRRRPFEFDVRPNVFLSLIVDSNADLPRLP